MMAAHSVIAAIFAFIAAVSIALMTAFNLGEKSNNFRTAWRRLNVAVIKFNQNICEKGDVINAYEEGEGLTYWRCNISSSKIRFV